MGESVFKNPEYVRNLNFVTDDLVKQIKEMRLTETDKEIFLKIKTVYDAIIDKSKLFEKASCQNGCSFCCHDRIIISKMEIDHIKNVIKTKGIEPNFERLEKQKTNFDNLSWSDKACSLLSEPDQEGKRICTIYEDRPFICRSHNSREEPKFCNKEEFPKRGIQEGRIIELDALATALVIVDVSEEEKKYGTALHDIL